MSIPNVRSHEKMKHTVEMEKIYNWKRRLKNKSKNKKVKLSKDEVHEEEYIPNSEILKLVNEKEVYAVDGYMEELQKIKGVY